MKHLFFLFALLLSQAVHAAPPLTEAVTIQSAGQASPGAVQNSSSLLNGPNGVVVLTGSGFLPILNGSLLTNVAASTVTGLTVTGSNVLTVSSTGTINSAAFQPTSAFDAAGAAAAAQAASQPLSSGLTSISGLSYSGSSTSGQVLTFTGPNTLTAQTPSGGGGGVSTLTLSGSGSYTQSGTSGAIVLSPAITSLSFGGTGTNYASTNAMYVAGAKTVLTTKGDIDSYNGITVAAVHAQTGVANNICFLTNQQSNTGVAGLTAWSNTTGKNVAAQTTAQNINSTANSPAGTYVIFPYLNVTAIAVDVVQMQVTFTDENSVSQTLTFFPMGLTSGLISTTGFVSYSPIVIRTAASTTITVATVLTTGGGTITYDAGAVIHQIN